MQFQVADRQEEPAVSVHYDKFYYLYGFPNIIVVIKFVSNTVTVGFSRSTVLHAVRWLYTVLSMTISFKSILLPFAVLRLCKDILNLVVKLTAAGIYKSGDLSQRVTLERFS